MSRRSADERRCRGELAADEVARNDLESSSLDPQLLAALGELLPGYWSRSNPVDLVAAVAPDLAERTLTALAESEAEAAFLRRASRLMERTGKPIINVPLRPHGTATFTGTGRHTPVILYSPVAAVRALAAMAWYREYVAARAGA